MPDARGLFGTFISQFLRVYVAPASAVHRHSSKEGSKKVIVLFKLGIFLICLSVLWSRAILLGAKPVIMCLFLSVDECGIGIGYFFEDFFGACVKGVIPYV